MSHREMVSGADAWLADVLPGFTLTGVEPVEIAIGAGESVGCDICGCELPVTHKLGEGYGMPTTYEAHGFEVYSVEDPGDSAEKPEKLAGCVVCEGCAADLVQLVSARAA